MMLYYQTKFGCKLTRSLEDTTEIVIFDHISLCCDLDSEHSEPIYLHDTLYGCMLHNHTSFGDKMFCGSEDIVQTNIP